MARLRGRVEVRFPELPNAQWVALRLLDGDERVGQAVESGELSLAYLTMFAGNPALQFAALPFMFTESAAARAAMDGELGQSAIDSIEASIGILDYKKDGLWVNYFLADGKSSPYAANLLGNLQHWLNEDLEIAGLMEKAPFINREDICRT